MNAYFFVRRSWLRKTDIFMERITYSLRKTCCHLEFNLFIRYYLDETVAVFLYEV